jgi:hypothetical protein
MKWLPHLASVASSELKTTELVQMRPIEIRTESQRTTIFLDRLKDSPCRPGVNRPSTAS